jgi:hypothetical protein
MRDEIKSGKDMKKNKMGGGMTNTSTSLPHPSAFDDPDSPVGDSGDSLAAFEQQRQAEILQEQDEALDGVFRTVGNLRQQAGDMGRELEEQVEILEDMGHAADRVEGKLKNGMKRVGWVLKHNEGEFVGKNGKFLQVKVRNLLTEIDVMSSCCITVLIFVLILLLVLLLIS